MANHIHTHMTKFSALSIADLRTLAANAARMARNVNFVVCVETSDGSWCELDADDQGHAGVLARNWVEKLGARGASCWRVWRFNGDLGTQAFYHIYDQGVRGDYHDDSPRTMTVRE